MYVTQHMNDGCYSTIIWPGPCLHVCIMYVHYTCRTCLYELSGPEKKYINNLYMLRIERNSKSTIIQVVIL